MRQNFLRACWTNPIQIGQANFHPLIAGQIDTFNSCHSSHHPCRCLCFGFSQITNTMPLRRTILHLAQRFRIDGETFMTTLLTNFFHSLYSQVFDYTRSSLLRPDYTKFTLLRSRDHRTVRIRGFPSVTAIECSKCAVNDPSAETTVHWSGRTRVSAVPASTMGSSAIVM